MLASLTTVTAIGGVDADAPTRARQPATAKQPSTKLQAAIAGWPEKPREVATTIAAKYGDPDEVTASMLVWYQRGRWKRTIVYREEVAHAFPKPHTDIVEQFIDYKVPIDKVDDLAAYDGSVVYQRTKGELSARCDKEEMNILALNLAHQVATGAKDTEGARRAYTEAAMAFMAKRPTAIVQQLQFKPSVGVTADPDHPAQPDKAASR
ncbi:MAG: hypothetical protein H0X17_05385 [Deltaproteobacteria bacterium]|nr:hypothetical protein [Deltaproteobacteria bacterium]